MTVTSSNISLNSVGVVTATAEEGVFVVCCNITDAEGQTYDTDYCSRPDDPYGLSPAVRAWLAANPSFPIQPFVPPTMDQIRAGMPPLTARQLRLGLVNSGLALAQVDAVIEAMPDGPEKETARIEWEYATTFVRGHAFITAISGALGLSEMEIDKMWSTAIDF
ncbi:hypothetical protein QN219_06370 [Sinorhizobium sp. 7-81]|uniref:hypothetical protein n=1 Tax=Sinorhizobium sp. 8-89 TaxID=3049089 RepID=UPI0024C2CB49|nr:hypothetical protein [Sinorhizobium sp. 8-89]MDK1489682.1 hypothetical protein [Sinorhizobium sp. 8-89]